jgi:hypothetical protein
MMALPLLFIEGVKGSKLDISEIRLLREDVARILLSACVEKGLTPRLQSMTRRNKPPRCPTLSTK